MVVWETMASGVRRFSTTALVLVCGIVACTGDDEIYAVPKDAGPLPDGTASSSSGGTASSSSSSSGGAMTDGATTSDAGDDGSTSADGGDGGTTTDSGTDSGIVDSGVDSGPVVCSTVACTSNLTCTALGCGSCNMGTKFCKP